MRKFWGGLFCIVVAIAAFAWTAPQAGSADDPPATPEATGDAKDTKDAKAEADSLTPLPDKQLTALHARFIKEAEKLAGQYLKNKQPDRAMAVYEEILKIVPDEPAAKRQVEKLRQFEATAGRKVLEVQANGGWQDTGIRVIAGKPLKLAASGTWTLNISQQFGPDGMEEMPKPFRDFRLGSLVGMIEDPTAKETKPFSIGAEKDLTSDRSGPLFVRMHDPDPSDNKGALTLEIKGRFDSETK